MTGPPLHDVWQFWIDVGGTFTDCIGRRPDGRLTRHPADRLPSSHPIEPHAAVPERTVETWFDLQPYTTGVYVRETIRPGDRLRGPAIVCEPASTTVIDPGWEGEVFSQGELLLTDRGGSGATAEARGADAVHTHMTNTRATDPEILEQRYPVRLWEFSIRPGSGNIEILPRCSTRKRRNSGEKWSAMPVVFSAGGLLLISSPGRARRE